MNLNKKLEKILYIQYLPDGVQLQEWQLAQIKSTIAEYLLENLPEEHTCLLEERLLELKEK